MENDSTRNDVGADIEDILAANRRKNAQASSGTAASRPASSVNAAQLRAQMQSSGPRPAASAAKPRQTVSTKPAASAAKPTQTASTKPAASAAKPTQTVSTKPAASAVKLTQTASTKSAASAAKTTQTASTKPATTTAKPTQTTAAKPTPIATTEKPTTPAAKPSASASPRRDTAGVPSLIPYQQASVTQKKTRQVSEPTRLTDVSGIRAARKNDGATRLTDVGDIRSMPLVPKEEEIKDESEGGNTVISIIKAITYIVAVVVVSVFLAVFIILVGNDVYAFVKEDTVVEITVPEYATLDDVADILYENNIIKYPNIFKLYANIKDDDGQFLAGTYSDMSPMMNYDELLAAFKPKKPSGISRITIPEGYTTDEIIDLFVSKGIGTREGYVDVINSYDFDYWFIDALEENGIPEGRFYRLDGYLFPDTYEVYNASTEEVVIGKLLKRFNEVFLDSYAQKAAELGYTVDEILIIASMIEKEAGMQSDFFNISSVFNNRLRNSAKFPYLQSDATVVYAIHHETGERITPTGEDMEYQSLYNTYLYAGLPPGPIANPSASAIRAALYPADTNYYYFVSASSRLTYFATTEAEHKKNIEKIKSGDTAAPENSTAAN